MIDLIFEGKILSEPDHIPVNPDLRDADYSEFYNRMNIFDELGHGDAVSFAVDGKYTETGKPILVTSIEDKNSYPSKY